MTSPLHPEAVRGRGATLNVVPSRFGLAAREADGDWLDAAATVDDAPFPLRTTVTVERPRSIITRNQSPDVPFDRSINAYRGCEHGCVYCFARPTHAYHDLSPGLDFESRLFAKPDAPALLKAELGKRGYQCQPIALGTNTDPYQPIERDWRITRQLLEVLDDCHHPVTITTKSDRVCRDRNILASMATRGLAAVMISVTTLDPQLARLMEPRAATPPRRLAAIRALAQAGVPVFVSLSPMIPAINDHEIEAIVAAAADAGAVGAYSIPVRLPHEVAPLFRDWLATHFPDRAARVMHHITSMRGGKDNDPRFFARFQAQGPYAALMRQRFHKACAAHGLSRDRIPLDCSQFRPPSDQLALF
ncbi:PA0069 family radical SAM protein [Sandarakinorhabdus sp. AAP62]|uniref:PA0069 family radical SAM protein n=1 Tax=Sandarakinorhabdus sp. AAP62 TaxID=1248916 RepID=UPI000307491C|nr:PA0069 family radical SAM protein [Sandarakinorhabdus sp. AAP62]